MNKSYLEKLDKSELVKLLLEKEKKRSAKTINDKPGYVRNDDTGRLIKIDGPTYKKLEKLKKLKKQAPVPEPAPGPTKPEPAPAPRPTKPEPALRKPVFKPVSAPRKYFPKPAPRPIKPVSVPRTNIIQLKKALRNSTKSFEVGIVKIKDPSDKLKTVRTKDPLEQLTTVRSGIAHRLINELIEMKGIKYVETLKITLKKQLDKNETIFKPAHFNNKVIEIVNKNGITKAVHQASEQIINTIAQWIVDGSNWTIVSIDAHYFNITKYNPLNGLSYIKLPAELINGKKGLINPKNKKDNECFR